MTFTSFEFILFAGVVVLAVQSTTSSRIRNMVLLAASAAFLLRSVDTWVQLLPLLGFVGYGYLCIELLRRTRSAALLASTIALALGLFLVLKRYTIVPVGWWLPFSYSMLGLSYVLFRVLHLMIDAQQGQVPARVPLADFAGYTLNFLTLSAGPIQTYPEYCAGRAKAERLDEPAAQAALARIVRGYVEVVAVSGAARLVFDALSARAGGSFAHALSLYAASAAAYTIYLYANFAGYMHIVIGLGRLVGVTLPENFNQPFAARSFLELWSRWHITLSVWFRTYLFNPLLKELTLRVQSRRLGPYLAALAFFVTFLVMGVWHGSTGAFVVYGLLLGAGACLNKGFQVALSRRLGKAAYRRLMDARPAVYLERGFTFAYFALALTCLWRDLPGLVALFRQLGLLGCALCLTLLGVGSALCFVVGDAARLVLTRLSRPSELRGRLGLVHHFSLAAQVLFTLGVGSFFHRAPEFVYRAF